MITFKFGGSSIKNANAIRNIETIVSLYSKNSLIIVISAIGKTTNLLEAILNTYIHGNINEATEKLDKLINFHRSICVDLFSILPDNIEQDFKKIKYETKRLFKNYNGKNFNQLYDSFISYGEYLSTRIISTYLNTKQHKNCWVDSKNIIKTDCKYRKANVDWEKTQNAINSNLLPLIKKGQNIIITQGFVGSTENGFYTTLGKEGSDFSATIIANYTKSDKIIIWKDVLGVYNANPLIFDFAEKIDTLNFDDTLLLNSFNTGILHPKTIEPILKSNITLEIRSFLFPHEKGTLISKHFKNIFNHPCFILKKNIYFIKFKKHNSTLFKSQDLVLIIELFNQIEIVIEMIQSNTIDLYFVISVNRQQKEKIKNKFDDKYKIDIETKCNILIILYYNEKTLQEHTNKNENLLIQKTKQHAFICYKTNN